MLRCCRNVPVPAQSADHGPLLHPAAARLHAALRRLPALPPPAVVPRLLPASPADSPGAATSNKERLYAVQISVSNPNDGRIA